jgi:hypothetical protein
MKTAYVLESFALKRHVATLGIECIDWCSERSGDAKIQELNRDATIDGFIATARFKNTDFNSVRKAVGKIRKWIILIPEPSRTFTSSEGVLWT